MRVTKAHLEYWLAAAQLPGWAEKIERSPAQRRVDSSIAAERARVRKNQLHALINGQAQTAKPSPEELKRENASSSLCAYLRGKSPADQWGTLTNFRRGEGGFARRAAFAKAWRARLEARMTAAAIHEAREKFARDYSFARLDGAA